MVLANNLLITKKYLTSIFMLAQKIKTQLSDTFIALFKMNTLMLNKNIQ
jgi:hypothetical protein